MARGSGGHRAIRCSGRRGPGGEVISAFRGRFQRGGQTCRAFFIHPEIVTGKRPSNRPPGRKVFLIRPGRAWRSGRTPKRIAFPRPVQGPRPHRTVPASATKASAHRGGRARLARGFGPRRVNGQRGAVTGAKAPANGALQQIFLFPVRQPLGLPLFSCRD